jgi:hypothetical protein
MKSVPIFILSKDRVSCLQAMLARLERDGLDNIFILDTESTYPPMIEFLESTKYSVIRCKPVDHHAPKFALWDSKVLDSLGFTDSHFVYTDSDTVPDDGCPSDWLDHLHRMLEKYPQFAKAGLGLKLADIPDCYAHKKHVLDHEHTFWMKELEKHVFSSELDTTIALYRPGSAHTYRAIRTGGKYLARHLPWYEDSANPSEESRYYRQHLHPKASFWTRRDNA